MNGTYVHKVPKALDRFNYKYLSSLASSYRHREYFYDVLEAPITEITCSLLLVIQSGAPYVRSKASVLVEVLVN